MSHKKVIRDSIHGYIELEDLFVRIIDSPQFQRLKWIEQGSFRVLYPAARHDRFIHSLGTYYLACQFFDGFQKNIKEDLDIDVADNLKNTFLYASLLHDIGHAPFSHTCEGLFTYEHQNNRIKIDDDLINAISSISGITQVNIDRFCSEFIKMARPSPHEIVSATILIKKSIAFLGAAKNDINLELAARMVIGCTYVYDDSNDNQKYGVENCLIRLLNSTTVDVDKLDYITRDTQMSGFDNVPIDIYRLAQSVSAISNPDGDIYPAFRKNALSVIDNVFKAKTAQGLWMISHPVVCYDTALLQACIEEYGRLTESSYSNTVFSIEALSEEGVIYNKKEYRLLSDVDIISDLKSKYNNSKLIKEFFDRGLRKHPAWKSYYEYEYLFDSHGQITSFFKPLIDFMKSERAFTLDIDLFRHKIENQDIRITAPAKVLKDFSDENHIVFDFTLLSAKNTFTPKFDASQIFIVFPNIASRTPYATYSSLKSETSLSQPVEKPYFYLYSAEKLDTTMLSKLKRKIEDTVRDSSRHKRRA